MLELLRIEENADETIGVLLLNDKLINIYTLEDAWRNNANNISCIPYGRYRVARVFSNSFGIETFTVKTENNEEPEPRKYVRFHWGNTHKDTEGCILLGCRVGTYDNNRAVLDSKVAFSKFMDAMALIESCDFVIRKC